jgi:sarcosine oxidase subunit beta
VKARRGYDLIVIGGGIIGCAAALSCARRKRRVLVLEADHCARHASGASAGGIRCLNRLVEEIPLSLAAREMWPELETDLGFDCGFRATAQIRIAENGADLRLLEQRAELTRSLGFRHEELIDRAELRRLVPAAAASCVGALMCRKDGYTRPIATTLAYRKRAEAEGVRILERHPVEAVVRGEHGWQVRTPQATFHAEALLNCAGAWGDRIAAMVGDRTPLQAAALALMVSAPCVPN